ncbi:MAG: AI-2E family transporter [Verrucomicrobiales bacterium]|nr:AI-2E family transporter [Verrucomicrobiales bacterium]
MRFLLSAACVIAIITALMLAESFLIPVVVAFFLCQLSLPMMKTLRRWKLPLPLAVGLTVIADILIITGVVIICVNLITSFQPTFAKALGAFKVVLNAWINDISVLAGIPEGEAPQSISQLAATQIDTIVGFVRQTDVIGRVTSLFSTAFFVLILMIFMLLEAGGLGGRMEAIRRLRGPNFAHLESVSTGIQKYLGIKTLVSVATGTMAGLVCLTLGVPGAILWGMVAFVLNFIPAIGSIIAAIPPILMAIVQYYSGDSLEWVWRSVGVLGGYVAINLALGNFIEPMLLGQRFGISTLVVLISVLFWGFVWGPVGMFLAVPLTMLVKVVLNQSVEFRWLAVALGKGVSMEDLKRAPTKRLVLDDDGFDPDSAGDVVSGVRDAGSGAEV